MNQCNTIHGGSHDQARAAPERRSRWSAATCASTSTRPISGAGTPRGCTSPTSSTRSRSSSPRARSSSSTACGTTASRSTRPALLRDVKGFVGQEAMHSREHRRYNAALARMPGCRSRELEARVKEHLDVVRERTIARGAAGGDDRARALHRDHGATTLLSDERLLDRRRPASRRDLALACDRGDGAQGRGLRRVPRRGRGAGRAAYVRRAIIMLLDHGRLLAARLPLPLRASCVPTARSRDLRGWWRLFRLLWVSPGGMRQLVRPWLSYFRRDFHPWQHDNSSHVERWKAAYAADGLAPPR